MQLCMHGSPFCKESLLAQVNDQLNVTQKWAYLRSHVHHISAMLLRMWQLLGTILP